MSTGFACEIRELAPGRWYYVLQDWSCPVGAWDWHEYASVVGPYVSSDAALDGLEKNEANPGAYSVLPFCDTERNKNLLAGAVQPRRR